MCSSDLEFLLVKGVRLVGGVSARHKRPTQDATKASPYSPMNRTEGFGSPSTNGILQGRFQSPLQLFLGHTPKTQLGAPKLCRSFTTRSLRGTSKPSRVHNAPKRQQALGNTMHPRVTSSQPSIPRITVGSTTRCNKCKRERSHQVVKSFTPKSKIGRASCRERVCQYV